MEDKVYIQHRDVEDRHWWFVSRRKILRPLIQAVMAGVEKDFIVDVGCGTGGSVADMAGDYNVLGIDSSQQAIEMAKTKYPDCEFVCGGMPEGLRDKADATALYTVMDVLEHIEGDAAFLADVVSLARPGSHILVTVPAGMELWSEHDLAAHHERRYELDGLAQLWRDLPVRPRVLTYFNARLYPAIWAARVVGKRLGLFSGKGGSDLAMPPAPLNALLGAIFSGEKHRVNRLMGDPAAKPYANGVSLLALLQKTG